MKQGIPQDSLVNFVKVQANLGWDEYFMLQALIASWKSKDPNTKVGCVFVDDNNHQLSMGYNGMVAGIDESQIPWGNNREVPLEYQKYGYVVHSEANAISHAKCSLKGSRLYVTLFPCHECAKLLASQRITEVIYLSDKYQDTAENRISKKILELSDITYRQLSLDSSIIDRFSGYMKETLAHI